MVMKRQNLKVHKPTIWIFVAVVILFMIISLIALNRSDKRHHRKFTPTKENIQAEKRVK